MLSKHLFLIREMKEKDNHTNTHTKQIYWVRQVMAIFVQFVILLYR